MQRFIGNSYTKVTMVGDDKIINSQRKIKNTLVVIMTIMLAFLTIAIYLQPQKQYTKLKILSHTGEYVQIQYPEPEIHTIQQHYDDIPPGDIGPINVTQIQSYLSTKKDKLKLAVGLLFDKDKKLKNQAQYYYYNKTYDLDKYRQQLPICIISPFKNFFAKSLHGGLDYLRSMQNQNYTNYQVLLADDLSTDRSTLRIMNIVRKSIPRLANRIKVMKTKMYTEMLGNHDILIRNHCRKGSIITHVDGDDQLIGRQVLKILNAVYQSQSKPWVVYSDFVILNNYYMRFGNGPIPDKVLDTYTYRSSGLWLASHLKTYLRQVYMKIPYQHFFRKPGKYYLFAGDRYSIYPVVELAGKKHTKYIDQLLYYYPQSTGQDLCYVHLMFMSEAVSRMKTPFLALQNLNDTAKQVPNYEQPKQVRKFWQYQIDHFYMCVPKVRRKIKEPKYVIDIKNDY